MAKLIFQERKKAENVVKDTSSPNHVRLTHSYHVIQVWRITKRDWSFAQRRYIITHYGWNDTRARQLDLPPDFNHDTLLGANWSEAEAIRRAINELDERISHYALPHADMSCHPAYRDVAPAPLAVVEG
jgi:hypothetical protein